MASLTLALTSLINHYLVKNVDFGDKIYDNAFIGIFSILLSSIFLYANDFFTKIFIIG